VFIALSLSAVAAQGKAVVAMARCVLPEHGPQPVVHDFPISKQDLINRIDDTMAQSTRWLSRNLPEHRGSFGNDGDIAMELNCSAYMLLPAAYACAGRYSEALRCVEYIDRTFLNADGSGCSSPEERGRMVPYAPAWTAVSAVQLGRPDMAYKLMGFVLTFQSRGRYGGFFGGRRESLSGRGVFCFDTTGEIDASTDGSSCLSLCLNRLTPLAADAHPHTLMMMPHRHPIP